jgi:tRNA nucleotidyltransferase (CCA-adding enzyme)
MVALSPPETVLAIARRLEEAGYEAWCVGGAVRDALLGHPHLDWDFATSATPEQVQRVFGRRRTVPVGIQFGTVGVLDEAGTLHEITTFRRDIKTDGRHAEVEFGATLDEDLARRDFTINAIAYSPLREELRDPFDGRGDLSRRLVRAVGKPDDRMREDRLRALRAIRFAARFEFAIEPATLAAVERSAPHMGRLSPERVKQELEKTMEQVARPGRALALWKSSGVLGTVIPSLLNIPEAIYGALDRLPPPRPAKPMRLFTRIAATFITLGETRARDALTALRFSKAETRRIAELARAWAAIAEEIGVAVLASRAIPAMQVRRWVARVGRLDLAPLMRIVNAYLLVRNPEEERVARNVRSLYKRMRRAAARDPITIADLTIDGDDLRASGIPMGPWVGKILQALLDAVLEEPAHNQRDWLLQEAQRLYDAMPRG